MPEDEVSLEGQQNDDYEVVPMGPIRKLERRIDNIETGASGGADDELIRDVLDIMKSNQKIVNDMTESTHELKNSVEDLTHKMDTVVDNMNSFMDLLKEASEMDMEGEMISDVQGQIANAVGDRMEDAVQDMQEQNQQIVDSLDQLNETMRKSYTSSRKDQIMQRGSKGQNAQSQNQTSQRSPSRQGQDTRRGSRNTEDSEAQSADERMKKLRQKFNKDQQ
ncbi:MAG: hypothetical protein ABEJ03_01690 [Candidatus Nanohaloarchaea archaeon]